MANKDEYTIKLCRRGEEICVLLPLPLPDKNGLAITANHRTNQDALPSKIASKLTAALQAIFFIQNTKIALKVKDQNLTASMVLNEASSHQVTAVSDHKHAVLQQDSETQPILGQRAIHNLL